MTVVNDNKSFKIDEPVVAIFQAVTIRSIIIIKDAWSTEETFLQAFAS